MLLCICLSLCFSSMLNIASRDSLVDKLTLISDLNDLLVPDYYGCLFVAKLNRKKKIFFFFEKIFVFSKVHIICRKRCFYMQKTFFTEKNINENVKNIYLISEIYFYTKNVCVTNKI